MPTPTFTKTGNKSTTTAKLDKNIFDIEVKSHSLLKQAYVAYQANERENLAKTLKRGEVRGGGKKPWKQKGTGRARFGSIRVPIWRGGGITFGPLGKENYSKKLPTSSKRKAIKQALSLKNKENNIIVIEDFSAKGGKTAEAVKLLSKVGAERKTLLVVENLTDEVMRSTNNLQNVNAVQAMYLNVANILNADKVVITSKALEIIEHWLGNSTKSPIKAQTDKEGAK